VRSERVCGGAGIPLPQYQASLGLGSLWIACPTLSTILRVGPRSGSVRSTLHAPAAFAVAAGPSRVWALGFGGIRLYGLDRATKRVVVRAALPAAASYVWSAGGAVWVGEDGALDRFSPTGKRVARFQLDHPSDVVSDGRTLLVIAHGDNTLHRIDLATNRISALGTQLAPPETAAVERVALRDGVLWLTGRGAGLLRVDPATGTVLGTTPLDPGGIDVAATSDAVWVAVYKAAAQRKGLPVVADLLRIDPSTGTVVRRLTPQSKLDLTAFVADAHRVWLVDGVAGRLLHVQG